MSKKLYDLTIVGSGPVGLFAAIYAGWHGLESKVLDGSSIVGGRLTAQYPEKIIHDVAGHPAVKASELVNQLFEEAKRKSEILLKQKVIGLEQDSNGHWLLKTDSEQHKSKAVIIAAGAGAFLSEGTKSIDAIRGVYYDVENPEEFKGKNVAIIGTGHEALDWATAILPHARKVTLAHRLNRLFAPGDVRESVDIGSIELLMPMMELAKIHGEDQVTGVTIVDIKTGDQHFRNVDAVVLNIGSVVNLNRFKEWDLEMTRNSINVNSKMETSLPGVFAVGDIVSTPGKLKLISVGAGEAGTAIKTIVSYIEGARKGKQHPETSEAKVLKHDIFYLSGYETVQLVELMQNRALKFYQTVFGRIESSEAKDQFAKLQRSKLDAISYTEQHLAGLFNTGQYEPDDLDELAKTYLSSLASSLVFSGQNMADEIGEMPTMNDLQAIFIGIQIERDLITYFKQLTKENKLSEAVPFLGELITRSDENLEALHRLQSRMMWQA
jgi:thioredoxin reductase